LRGRRSIVPAQSEHIEEWDDECFMGGVLQSYAGIGAVSMHGTCGRRQLRHTCGNIAYFGWRCRKGSMDGSDSRGYLFDDATVTESFGVELGPLPLPDPGLGEGTKIEAREVA
jgi:hypothetical protein